MSEKVQNTFRLQLSSVMDSLLTAAVCEISKIFEGSLSEQQAELTQSVEEISALKGKLRLAEMRLKEGGENKDLADTAANTSGQAVSDVTTIPEIEEEVPDWCEPLQSEDSLIPPSKMKKEDEMPWVDLRPLSVSLWRIPNIKIEQAEDFDNHLLTALARSPPRKGLAAEWLLNRRLRGLPELGATGSGYSHVSVGRGRGKGLRKTHGRLLRMFEQENPEPQSNDLSNKNVLSHHTRQGKNSDLQNKHSEGSHGKMSDIMKKVGRRRKHFKMEPDADKQAAISGTDKSFSCKYCGKGFGREFGLSVHMRSHKKVKIKGTYQCPKCPKKFQYPSALSVHTRDSHEKKKPCSSVKEMSDSVKYKVKPLSPSKAKPTSCNNKPLSASKAKPLSPKDKPVSPNNKDGTTKESSTHPKVYSCYVCHKKYTSAHSLRDHGRIHTGERPYPCNQCGQRFRVKQFLILHLRKAHADVYGGEESSGDLSWTEPVEEPMANGAEQQPAIKSKGKDDRQAKANSKRQQMTETDGLFQCTVCKMLLSSQVSLVQHFRIHTGEKPPSCEVWQKSPLPSRLDQPLEVCPPGKEVVVPEVCEAIRDNGRT